MGLTTGFILGLGLEEDNISRPFLGNVGLVVDRADAAPGDVDGVVPEVWHVTLMDVLLGLATFHLSGTLPVEHKDTVVKFEFWINECSGQMEIKRRPKPNPLLRTANRKHLKTKVKTQKYI